MAIAKRTKTRKSLSSYTVQLSSNLNSHSALSPAEATFAMVEPYGAVTLCRFISDQEVQFIELSSAEVDALVATNRRRKALMKRWCEDRSSVDDRSDGDPFYYPF